MEDGCVYRNTFLLLLTSPFSFIFFLGTNFFIFHWNPIYFPVCLFGAWPVRPVFKSEWNISNFVLCVDIDAINTITGTIRNHLLGLNNILSQPFTLFCFHY